MISPTFRSFAIFTTFSAVFGVYMSHAHTLNHGDQQPPLVPRSEIGPNPVIPATGSSNSKSPDVIGWPKGKTPVAPAGFKVQQFATDLKSPRWIYTLPNGDVLISEASGNPITSANPISLFRGLNPDGSAKLDTTFVKGLIAISVCCF